MSSRKFKAGDRVVCVDNGSTGLSDCPLRIGAEYEVLSFDAPQRVRLKLPGNYGRCGWYSDRFELVSRVGSPTQPDPYPRKCIKCDRRGNTKGGRINLVRVGSDVCVVCETAAAEPHVPRTTRRVVEGPEYPSLSAGAIAGPMGARRG